MASRRFSKAPILVLFALAAVLSVVWDEASSPLLYQTLRGNTSYHPGRLFVPPSLERQRALSLNLGGGACKWEPPVYEVPGDVDFHKTVVAGFPSGDKRVIYLQMEALTGYPAKDEWDFAFEGMTNHPFIKANYPHHEGIWGWGSAADQVVMVVPHIRDAMVEYHDILWDLGYPTTWEDSSLRSDLLYGAQPSPEEWYEWRDERVLDEARWYGWFIDYWMEGGLMRGIFTHKVTTPEHWNALLSKPFYTRGELIYGNFVGNDTVVTPTYDPHCASGEISGGCEPVAVLSADKIMDYADGPAETSLVATALMNDARTGQYVIAPEAWDCIWDELIVQRKGPKIMRDRPGYGSAGGFNFAAEMLEEMIDELDRLIAKYDGPEWDPKPTASRLVGILVGHRASVQTELNEVLAGTRKLKDDDFLGPKERAKRRDERLGEREERLRAKAERERTRDERERARDLKEERERTRDERARRMELRRNETERGDLARADAKQSPSIREREDRSRYFIDLLQERYDNKRLKAEEAAKTNPDSKSAAVSRAISDTLEQITDTLEEIRSLELAGGIDRGDAKDMVGTVAEIGEMIMPL